MVFLRRKQLKILSMTIGSAFMAVGIRSFYDPIGLVTGGISGIAIIIRELSGTIPLGVTNIILNIPLFVFGWRIFGLKRIYNTLYSTVMLSVWLMIIPQYVITTNDYFLSAVFGGILTGIGIGLVFSADATTGGTDLLAALIKQRMPMYSVAQIMQVIDGFVVLLGAFVFGIEAALYAIIAVYLVSKVSDGILEGMNFAKLLYIVSDRYEDISEYILNNLGRGVTALNGSGIYSGKEKSILLCAVSKKETVLVRNAVCDIDPNAFVILCDAREVLGNGFRENLRL